MNGNAGSLLQAVRGPIMLITLGTLMAIDHFGPFSFSHTWPVLFIVFGLMKLLEHVTASTGGPIA